jgi:hypothetical protein
MAKASFDWLRVGCLSAPLGWGSKRVRWLNRPDRDVVDAADHMLVPQSGTCGNGINGGGGQIRWE